MTFRDLSSRERPRISHPKQIIKKDNNNIITYQAEKTIIIVAIALTIIIILSVVLLYWKHVSVQHQQNQIQQEQLIQETRTSSDTIFEEVLVSNNTAINLELVKQELCQSNRVSNKKIAIQESCQNKRSILVDYQNDEIKLCCGAVVGDGSTGNVQARSYRPKRSKMPKNKENKNMLWMSLSKINKDLIDKKGKFFMLI